MTTRRRDDLAEACHVKPGGARTKMAVCAGCFDDWEDERGIEESPRLRQRVLDGRPFASRRLFDKFGGIVEGQVDEMGRTYSGQGEIPTTKELLVAVSRGDWFALR